MIRHTLCRVTNLIGREIAVLQTASLPTNRRLLATIASNADDEWLLTSQTLLGSESPWTIKEWDDAREAITSTPVDIAWQIMDRAVQEDCAKRSLSTQTPDILREMVNTWKKNPTISVQEVMEKIDTYHSMLPELKPSIQLYNVLLDKAVKNRQPNCHELAEQFIQSRIGDGEKFDTETCPNIWTFNIAIDAHANSGMLDAPQRAEALLQKMKDLKSRGWTKLKPNVETYEGLLTAWAKSDQLEAPQRAEELLKETPYPNTSCYNAVMDSWSKSTVVGSDDRCIQIFQEMKKLSTSKDGTHVNLNATSYGTVMTALANNGKAADAEAVLEELLSQYKESKDFGFSPHRSHFHTIIDAWAKSGDAQRADDILTKMHDMAKETKNPNLVPDEKSFAAVLHAWAKSKDVIAPARVEALIKQMHDLAVIRMGATPGVLSYNIALRCLANFKSIDAAVRAEAILNLMIDSYKAGNEDVKPDIFSFNTVINAFAKSRSGESAVKAEGIFDRMKECDIQPDKRTFSSLISAWSNSYDPQAAVKAEDFLSEMKRRYELGDEACRPDVVAFTAVVHAWSSSKDPNASQRALALLDEMKRLQDSGLENCGPTVITYTALLKAVARSRSTTKAELALTLLSEMEERLIQPDALVFRAVLMACAFSNRHSQESREQAFKIALKIMRRVRSQNMPSRDGFCLFFQTAAGLGHDKTVEAVYEWCCVVGLGNDEAIMAALANAAPNLVKK